ncbi:hypothetical protein KQI08_11390 [Paraeggerthella hongkongensis]|uniref:hypothetical protein n=1 Tax=Paraeggerthella hominis TaxID=2897351 RepID=UPI001C10C5F5|nr:MULTISPECIES: hypothetical protein [Paraeggerthella]MBU5406502.1 hypothetical protein [Paraeggerthella hongkongensis]MCD2434268.1 hypothetical protein [Paraeggerthella hominis]
MANPYIGIEYIDDQFFHQTEIRYCNKIKQAFLKLPSDVKFDIMLTEAMGPFWDDLKAESKQAVFEAFLKREEEGELLVHDNIFSDVDEACEEESERDLADYLDRMLMPGNLSKKRKAAPRYSYGFIDFGEN